MSDAAERADEERAFLEWCDGLDAAALALGMAGPPITQQTGRDCWRHHFEVGTSPDAALLDDLWNAA